MSRSHAQSILTLHATSLASALRELRAADFDTLVTLAYDRHSESTLDAPDELMRAAYDEIEATADSGRGFQRE